MRRFPLFDPTSSARPTRRIPLSVALAILVATLLGSAGCADEPVVCGAGGVRREIGASIFCAYAREAIVIEGGFDCPPALRHRLDLAFGVICTNDGSIAIDEVPESVCAGFGCGGVGGGTEGLPACAADLDASDVGSTCAGFWTCERACPCGEERYQCVRSEIRAVLTEGGCHACDEPSADEGDVVVLTEAALCYAPERLADRRVRVDAVITERRVARETTCTDTCCEESFGPLVICNDDTVIGAVLLSGDRAVDWRRDPASRAAGASTDPAWRQPTTSAFGCSGTSCSRGCTPFGADELVDLGTGKRVVLEGVISREVGVIYGTPRSDTADGDLPAGATVTEWATGAATPRVREFGLRVSEADVPVTQCGLPGVPADVPCCEGTRSGVRPTRGGGPGIPALAIPFDAASESWLRAATTAVDVRWGGIAATGDVDWPRALMLEVAPATTVTIRLSAALTVLPNFATGATVRMRARRPAMSSGLGGAVDFRVEAADGRLLYALVSLPSGPPTVWDFASPVEFGPFVPWCRSIYAQPLPGTEFCRIGTAHERLTLGGLVPGIGAGESARIEVAAQRFDVTNYGYADTNVPAEGGVCLPYYPPTAAIAIVAAP